ncbi:MAG TPA: hypothetical protein DIU29_01980 [Candidatus Jacksonbacteria bacterium]|nr:MAG: hypothetical protein A2240_03900 [Candidatus Jacksonbacteria bacterium RIFOXYA2_FULL_43_12]HCC50374.1 hypothetical protein [Candidatus Jacksonbacteria bacterium]HCR14974.1 hypothetical protein [Candidatus Jacksonbacteria bacterium]
MILPDLLTDCEDITSRAYFDKEGPKLNVTITDPFDSEEPYLFRFSLDAAKRALESFALDMQNPAPHNYLWIDFKKAKSSEWHFTNLALAKLWVIFQFFVNQCELLTNLDEKGETQ